MYRTIGAVLSFAVLMSGFPAGMVQAAPVLWQMQRVGESTQIYPEEHTVAISPDSRRVASAGTGLRLWDAVTGEPIGKPMLKHRDGISVIVWSPDGRFIATGGYDGLLVLWDAERRELLWEAPTGHGYVHAVVFSPDGARIATGGRKDGIIRLWERATGREIGQPLTGHDKDVTALAFAGDGKTLISTGRDSTVRVWNTDTRSALRAPIQTGMANGPTRLVKHPRQPVVAISNHDSIAFWNHETGVSVARTLTGYGSAHGMSALAFTEDGERVMAADSFGGMALIDWRKGEPVARGVVEHRAVIVWQSAFSSKGDLIATAGKDGVLGIWRTSVLRDTAGFSVVSTKRIPHPRDGAWTVYSDNGYYIAHLGKGILIVNRATGEVVYTDNGLDRVGPVAFSANNQWFAYAGPKDQVVVVHLPSKRRVVAAAGPVNFYRTMALSPDGSRLAIGIQMSGRNDTSDNVIMVETRGGNVVGRYAFDNIPYHNQVVSGLAFSPDGNFLLAATQGGDVARLDAATMRATGSLWTGLGSMVVFSHDGRRVATARHAGHDNTHAVIVDAVSGMQLTGPMSPMSADARISSVAFTPDGRFLLIAAGDRVVTLWDAASGERLGRNLLQYEHAMRNIRLTSDARRVYATSGEGKVYSPFLLMEWEIAIDASRFRNAPAAPAVSVRRAAPAGEIVTRMQSGDSGAAAFVPGSSQLALGGWGTLRFMQDGNIRETGDYIDNGDGPRPEAAMINYVAVSRDGRLASAAPDGAGMRIYDVVTGKRVSMIGNSGYGPGNYIAHGHGSHTFLADGKLALTWENGVRIFDPEKGTALSDQRLPLDGVPTAIAGGNQSPLIALGTDQGMLLIVSADGGTLPISIERAHHGQVVEVAFSPDDRVVATGGVEGSVRLFDTATGRAIAGPWRAHALAVTALAFSADGGYLASGGGDGTFRVWSLRTGEPVTPALVGHSEPVLVMMAEKAGQWLTYARDGTLRRWHIPSVSEGVKPGAGTR
jgi:WD40 repeat protein